MRCFKGKQLKKHRNFLGEIIGKGRLLVSVNKAADDPKDKEDNSKQMAVDPFIYFNDGWKAIFRMI
ncbi:hypothetical protein [Bacillus mycoides]|uniref:hypothetical protein n=1 Tax=Bacillus mycoides TaxID=1405 RepID=UPI000BF15C8F|nr:hypothetical protein [Bacillus mycoides]PEK88220.1 hypothetical protein CN600_27070 [Bacillus mycoides]